jgi:S-methylmethionine-dependent homocysteine/selenocysteine methylase
MRKVRPRVLDGGIGGELARREAAAGPAATLAANLDAPNAVRKAHRAMIRAGCDVVRTNTSGLTPAIVRSLGGGRGGIDRMAIKLATLAAQHANHAVKREGAGRRALVAGVLPPLDTEEALGDAAFLRAYRLLADTLAPVTDVLLADRITSSRAAVSAVNASAATGAPIWIWWHCVVTPGQGGAAALPSGEPLEHAAAKVAASSPLAWIDAQVACGAASATSVAVLPTLEACARELPTTSLLGCAATAAAYDGEAATSPEALATLVRPLLERGCSIVGGGDDATTTAHVAASKGVVAGFLER